MSTMMEKIEAQRLALQSTDCAHLRHLVGSTELEQLFTDRDKMTKTIGMILDEHEKIVIRMVKNTSVLQPIATAPRDGTWILLFGPSGYIGTPLRAEVGRWAGRGREGWRTHANDWFTDGGAEPTHWMPLPEVGK